MKKILSIIVFLTVLFATVNAQIATFNKKEKKAYKKAEKYNKKGTYDEAIAIFEPVLLAHKTESEVWDVALTYYYNKSRIFGNLSFTITTSGGDDGGLADVLRDIMNKPGLVYYDALRRCMLMCGDNLMAQIYARNHFVDKLYPVDTSISPAAKKQFNKAEDAFVKGSYSQAAEYYRAALDIEPEYYKATMYLGDALYHLGKYGKAIEYYSLAATQNPYLLEPQKYLTDAFIGQKSYDDAYDACIDGIMRFPDANMFDKLKFINSELNFNFNRHWMSRNYEINTIKGKHEAIADPVWGVYRDALEEIKSFCDTTGVIIKENTLTKSKYLEEYSWEQLLSKNRSADEFAFAREMQEKGFLDCYVLISLFHVDLYSQQQHLVKNNPDKVKQYLKMLRS
ncbi:MAG: tetratricopeptide repeat protein [Bacteroidota bacterium]